MGILVILGVIVVTVIAGFVFFAFAEERQRVERDRQRHAEAVERQQQFQNQERVLREEQEAKRRQADADRRIAEEEYERKRVEGWVELGRKKPAEAIALIDDIPELVNAAIAMLRECLRLYAAPRYYPFWESAFAALAAIQDIDSTLKKIVLTKVDYYHAASLAPGRLPPFIDLDGFEETEHIIRLLRARLMEVVDRAHGDRDFTATYVGIRIENAIRQGLDNLGQRLDNIERAINSNTILLSARLSDLTAEVSEVNSRLEINNRQMTQLNKYQAQWFYSGIRQATAAIDNNTREAQRKANASISQLRQLNLKMDFMR